MPEQYANKELLKLLPQKWPDEIVGLVDEDYEDGAKIELGKENELLPSGRMKPLIEMIIEDKENNSKALDDIDNEMEVNPYETQMIAAGMGEETGSC